MLRLSIGLPGRFAAWCDAVVVRLGGGPANRASLCELAPVAASLDYGALPPSLDQLTRTLIGSPAAGAVVISARQPDIGLLDALAHSDARFIVALDHPRVAAADMMEDTGADMRLVTRAVANSCALIMRYPPLPGALTLHGDAARADPVGTVLTVARHIGAEIGEAEAQSLVDELASDGHDLQAATASWLERIPTDAQKTVGGALYGYEECFAGRGMGRIAWNRDLFFVGETDRRATGILEIPAEPGILFRGPHMHLPPGSWTARVHLGFSPELVGCGFRIEIHGESLLAEAVMQPTHPGIHALDCGFILPETGGGGIQFRIGPLNQEARGRVAFGHAVLTPAAMQHPEAATDWEEEFKATLDFSV